MNIFVDIKESLPEEEFLELLSARQVRIERIVSTGHCSPDDFWYDQAEHEWVLVLAGRGVVEYSDGQVITLNPGDYLNIPAHQKHRVKETSSEEPTVWLAVFYR